MRRPHLLLLFRRRRRRHCPLKRRLLGSPPEAARRLRPRRVPAAASGPSGRSLAGDGQAPWRFKRSAAARRRAHRQRRFVSTDGVHVLATLNSFQHNAPAGRRRPLVRVNGVPGRVLWPFTSAGSTRIPHRHVFSSLQPQAARRSSLMMSCAGSDGSYRRPSTGPCIRPWSALARKAITWSIHNRQCYRPRIACRRAEPIQVPHAHAHAAAALCTLHVYNEHVLTWAMHARLHGRHACRPIQSLGMLTCVQSSLHACDPAS